MKIETTADYKQTDELLKSLAFVALLLHNDNADEPVDITEVSKYINRWKASATPVLDKHGISTTLFNSIVEMAIRGDDGFANKAKAFRKQINDNAKKMMVDYRSVSDMQKSILTAILTYYNSASENAWKTLVNRVAELKSPSLTRAFVDSEHSSEDVEPSDQKGLLLKLKQATKPLTNKSHDMFLTVREQQELEAKNPKAKELYKETYAELRAIFMKALKSIVTSGPSRYMAIPEVLEKMKSKGIHFNMFARNSNHKGLFVNEKGNIGITPDGDVSSATSIVNPNQVITINPKFDFKNPTAPTNGYVYTYQQSDQSLAPGKQNKVYGSGTNTKNAQKNLTNVKDLHKHIHDYINKWRADLDKPTEAGINASIAETAYLTSARLQGQGGESKGEATFGILTITVGHVIHVDDKGIELKFRAKSGKMQHIKLLVAKMEPKNKPALIQLIKNFKALIKNKKPNEHLFTFKKHPISYQAYRTYLKTRIGYQGNPHKFRHVRGTSMFNELIAASPFKKGQKVNSNEAMAFFKKVMTEIGDKLGHKNGDDEPTATTAMRYYVDPEPMAEYFSNLNLRPPKIVVERLNKLGIQEGHNNDEQQQEAAEPVTTKEPVQKTAKPKAAAPAKQSPKTSKPTAKNVKLPVEDEDEEPDSNPNDSVPDDDDDEIPTPANKKSTVNTKSLRDSARVQTKEAPSKKIAIVTPPKLKPSNVDQDRLAEHDAAKKLRGLKSQLVEFKQELKTAKSERAKQTALKAIKETNTKIAALENAPKIKDKPAAAPAAPVEDKLTATQLISQISKLQKQMLKHIDKNEKRAIVNKIVELTKRLSALHTNEPIADDDEPEVKHAPIKAVKPKPKADVDPDEEEETEDNSEAPDEQPVKPVSNGKRVRRFSAFD